MNPLALAAFASAVSFAAGGIFHKYVISEAQAIKDHVSDAEARIRAEVVTLAKAAAAKL